MASEATNRIAIMGGASPGRGAGSGWRSRSSTLPHSPPPPEHSALGTPSSNDAHWQGLGSEGWGFLVPPHFTAFRKSLRPD